LTDPTVKILSRRWAGRNITKRVGTSGSGEKVGKGHRRVNMVKILCTHICKWKNDTCSNYSRNEGKRRVKEKWWRR
jgi:hypothetical protein